LPVNGEREQIKREQVERKTNNEIFGPFGSLKQYERIELPQLRIEGHTIGKKQRVGRFFDAAVFYGAIPMPQLPDTLFPAGRFTS
jgi:hypothetical protein